ncbi:hypothetical protein [Candidatus Leptofilum sp.]
MNCVVSSDCLGETAVSLLTYAKIQAFKIAKWAARRDAEAAAR